MMQPRAEEEGILAGLPATVAVLAAGALAWWLIISLVFLVLGALG